MKLYTSQSAISIPWPKPLLKTHNHTYHCQVLTQALWGGRDQNVGTPGKTREACRCQYLQDHHMEPDCPLSWLSKGVFKPAARTPRSGADLWAGRPSLHLKSFQVAPTA